MGNFALTITYESEILFKITAHPLSKTDGSQGGKLGLDKNFTEVCSDLDINHRKLQVISYKQSLGKLWAMLSQWERKYPTNKDYPRRSSKYRSKTLVQHHFKPINFRQSFSKVWVRLGQIKRNYDPTLDLKDVCNDLWNVFLSLYPQVLFFIK